MFEMKETPLDIVREVTQEEVTDNYVKIDEEVQAILNGEPLPVSE